MNFLFPIEEYAANPPSEPPRAAMRFRARWPWTWTSPVLVSVVARPNSAATLAGEIGQGCGQVLELFAEHGGDAGR
jgi:hypothetical protein